MIGKNQIDINHFTFSECQKKQPKKFPKARKQINTYIRLTGFRVLAQNHRVTL